MNGYSNIDSSALREAVEAVEENNRINGGRWSDWDGAYQVCETYGIALGADGQAVLERAITSDGESLRIDLPAVELAVWGQNFSGSWWSAQR